MFKDKVLTLKDKFENFSIAKIAGATALFSTIATNAFAAEGDATLSQALSDGTNILNAGWSFISSNAILFSVASFGLIVGAVKVVRKFV